MILDNEKAKTWLKDMTIFGSEIDALEEDFAEWTGVDVTPPSAYRCRIFYHLCKSAPTLTAHVEDIVRELVATFDNEGVVHETRLLGRAADFVYYQLFFFDNDAEAVLYKLRYF